MAKKEQPKKKQMNTDIKVFLVVSAVIVVALIALVIYLSAPKAETVATVGNSAVTSDEFQYYLSINISEALKSKPDANMDNQTYLNTNTGSGTILDSLKQQTLTQAVQVKLLLIKAKEDGFKVSGSELDSAWQAYLTSTLEPGAQSSQISVKDFAKTALGVSLGAAEKVFKEYTLSQKYFQTKASELTIDESKLPDYYKANKGSFDTATVRHILISCSKDADAATVADKKKLAEDILAKVNNGEDFSALVKQYSADSGSINTGGAYTIQPNGQMVPEFQDWTFSHKAGDTGIIRSDYGFHVMKLDSISDTFEAAKKDVEQAYKSNEFGKQLQDLLTNNAKYKVAVKDALSKY